MRVLVVDDEPDMVLSLEALLRTEGHEPRCLYEARKIVQHVQEFGPDAVILDLAMPGKTGWDAAEEIRAMPGRRPVLVGVSGEHTSGADRTRSERSGFDFYLRKPFDPNVLLTLLRWLGIQSPFRSALRR